MSHYRLGVLIVLSAGLVACDEHSAFHTTTKVDIPPATIGPTTVELVVSGATVIGPDGQRAAPAESATLLPADTHKVALKVCKGSPHATVTQTLQTLQAGKVSVTVSGADPVRCG